MNKWVAYMDSGVFYATCSDCSFDTRLENARQYDECPICAKPKTVDTSMWIAYNGEPILGKANENIAVCPKCMTVQDLTEYAEDKCHKCGIRLKTFWTQTATEIRNNL